MWDGRSKKKKGLQKDITDAKIERSKLWREGTVCTERKVQLLVWGGKTAEWFICWQLPQ